jgi:Domain of unknown function (DUF5615)
VRARLLADANFDFRIVHGLRKRVPAIDFVLPHGLIRPRLPDPEVLALAANLGRVLVSHDLATMPDHFSRLLSSRESPGLVLIPNTYPIGSAIFQLELAWTCSAPDEFRNRITWLPY